MGSANAPRRSRRSTGRWRRLPDDRPGRLFALVPLVGHRPHHVPGEVVDPGFDLELVCAQVEREVTHGEPSISLPSEKGTIPHERPVVGPARADGGCQGDPACSWAIPLTRKPGMLRPNDVRAAPTMPTPRGELRRSREGLVAGPGESQLGRTSLTRPWAPAPPRTRPPDPLRGRGSRSSEWRSGARTRPHLVGLRDEAVALLGVEPLDRSGCHCDNPLLFLRCCSPTAGRRHAPVTRAVVSHHRAGAPRRLADSRRTGRDHFSRGR